MKRLFALCLLAIAVAQVPAMSQAATAASAVSDGALLFSEDGHRLGAIYKVTDDGSAKLILEGKIVTIPASTMSEVNGKLTTTLTKVQVYELKQQASNG
jgi:hypothetical protein